MKTNTKIVIAAISGAVLGGGIGYFATKTYLEKKLSEEKSNEIQEIRKKYKEKYSKVDKSDEKEDPTDKKSEEIDGENESEPENSSEDDDLVTVKDGIATQKDIKQIKKITEYKNYGSFYNNEVKTGKIFGGYPEDEYEDDENNAEFEEMEKEMLKNEHPRDDDGAYIVDDIDDEPDYMDLDPIPVTLYLGDGVLAEDIGNKVVNPDENSIPRALLDEIIADERTDIYVKNPKGGVMYELTKTDDSYEDIMNDYHGGYDPNYE